MRLTNVFQNYISIMTILLRYKMFLVAAKSNAIIDCIAQNEMESLFEKRLFFAGLKLRPTEAHFETYKKRSLIKACNVMLEIASKRL